MQAQLTFRLPEERTDHQLAVNGASYHTVLWRLDLELRARLQDEPLHPVRREECEYIRDLLYRLMANQEVSFVE
jgi:hypothetical protein